MPPKNKIAANDAVSKENYNGPSCIYCGFLRCWKHGRYFRKWFHLRGACHPHGAKSVQRYLCQCPSCKRTFSVLPENVLPYCHFHLDDLLSIAQDMTAGKSCYRIAKTVWGLSLRVLGNAAVLIKKATPLLEELCREASGSVESGFQLLIKAVREKFSWLDITRRWFHALYPCRAGNIFNPHKLGIKRL